MMMIMMVISLQQKLLNMSYLSSPMLGPPQTWGLGGKMNPLGGSSHLVEWNPIVTPIDKSWKGHLEGEQTPLRGLTNRGC